MKGALLLSASILIAAGIGAGLTYKFARYSYLPMRDGYVEIDRLTQEKRRCTIPTSIVAVCVPLVGNHIP